jgi:hypothetical protein
MNRTIVSPSNLLAISYDPEARTLYQSIEDDQVRRSKRLDMVVFTVLCFTCATLVGCATGPIVEVPEHTSVQAPPIVSRRIEFPAKKFSVESPPAPWKVTQEHANVVVAWKNSVTRSAININASPRSELSDRGRAELFITAFKLHLQEHNQQVTVTLAEEKEVRFNGQGFYQVLANFDFSPTESVQVRGKLLTYLCKADGFNYQMTLIAGIGAYKEDRLIMEQMVQSFAALQ